MNGISFSKSYGRVFVGYLLFCSAELLRKFRGRRKELVTALVARCHTNAK